MQGFFTALKPFTANILFGTGIAAINIINARKDPRLIGFSLIKGATYGFAWEISAICMLFSYERFENHLIPASVHCKFLRDKASQ